MAEGTPNRRAVLLLPLMLTVLLPTAIGIRTLASTTQVRWSDLANQAKPRALSHLADPAKHRALSQVRQLATATPCTFSTDPDTGFTDCSVNPSFIATQTAYIDKSGSKLAKYTLLPPLRDAACSKHNVTYNGIYYPKNADACLADKANNCTLAFSSSDNSVACISIYSNIAAAAAFCPGSDYYWQYYCAAVTNKTQCGLSGGKCTYSAFGPYRDNAANAKVAKAKGVSDAYIQIMQDSVSCMSTQAYKMYYPKGSPNATNCNYTNFDAWNNNYFYSPDPKVFLSAQGRGNCSVSQNAFARALMDSTCAAFNTVEIPAYGIMGIARSDRYTVIVPVAKAQAAGCVFGIGHSPGSTAAGFNFMVAQYDSSKYNSLLFDAKLDGSVYKAYTMCTQVARSFSASLCNAVTP